MLVSFAVTALFLGFYLVEVEGEKVLVKRDSDMLSSDEEVLRLSLVERKYRILSRLTAAFRDLPNPELIVHGLKALISQRVFGLCQGYEDLNDHDRWRRDPLLAMAYGMGPDESGLASRRTLNRLELGDTPKQAKERYKNIR